MKFRHSGGDADKIEAQMAPMIDVVFQLLIFFMLTLKIIEPEGDFTVNMPQGRPQATETIERQIDPKAVKMTARSDGTLSQLTFATHIIPIRRSTDTAQIQQYKKINSKELLSDEQAAMRIGEDIAFADLTNRVEKWVRSQRPSFTNSKADQEEFEKLIKIKLSFDYKLHNRYIIKATSACRGKVIEGRDRPLDLVKNIEFIRPAAPGSP